MKYHLTQHALNRLAYRSLLTKPDGTPDLNLTHQIFSKELEKHELINNLKRRNNNRYTTNVKTNRYKFEMVISFVPLTDGGIAASVITAYNLAIKNERTGSYEPTEQIDYTQAIEESLKETGNVEN